MLKISTVSCLSGVTLRTDPSVLVHDTNLQKAPDWKRMTHLLLVLILASTAQPEPVSIRGVADALDRGIVTTIAGEQLCSDESLPAFYRSRWASPRLRILIAILAAAFAGNVYFHLVREHELLFGGDGEALVSFLVPRMIYCGLLALGIWLSMLRQQERRRQGAAPTGIVALRAIAGVWTFYGLIHLWIASPFEFGVAQRWDFLLSLAGL